MGKLTAFRQQLCLSLLFLFLRALFRDRCIGCQFSDQLLEPHFYFYSRQVTYRLIIWVLFLL